VIPQNPHLSEEWIADLGSNWAEIQKRLLHTIGNLTFTSYNSEMSDSSFANKLTMEGGFQESALRLNKYIVTQTHWGEQQVLERARQLGEIARKAWPYPSLTEAELEPYRKPDPSTKRFTLDTYEHINAYNKMLFKALDRRITELSPFVKREFKKRYIAYKVDTNFVDIEIQKQRLRLTINMKYADVIDPKGICKDITDLGRWGNGDVEVGLDSLDSLDDVMTIIEQAYRIQDVD